MKMTEEQLELHMLRAFFQAWKDFHAIAKIHGISEEDKKTRAQTMVDLAHTIDLAKKPIIEMAHG